MIVYFYGGICTQSGLRMTAFVGFPKGGIYEKLCTGFFLSVSDNRRKIFVWISFKPLFSFFSIIAASRIIYLEEPDRNRTGPSTFTSASIPCLWISFNVFASICVHLHKPFNGIFNFNSYLITVPLNNFDDRIICREQDRTR